MTLAEAWKKFRELTGARDVKRELKGDARAGALERFFLHELGAQDSALKDLSKEKADRFQENMAFAARLFACMEMDLGQKLSQ